MAPRAIIIALRGAPVGKGRGRIGKLRDGRPVVFTPAATRSYEASLRVAGTDAMEGLEPLDGPVGIEVVATFPVAASWSGVRRRQALAGQLLPTTKPDSDNILKICADSLNQIVWCDDRQIVQATVIKRYGAEPGVVIRAWSLAPAVAQPSLPQVAA